MSAKVILQTLQAEWAQCARCNLAALRGAGETVVFGTGGLRPDYLFVYDAPEEQDMESGKPLAGPHGKLLERLIKKAEYPSSSYAITTTVGCRAYTTLPAIGDQREQVRDRDPSQEEVDACRPRLSTIIYALDPRIIFAVGTVAWKALVKPKDRGCNVLSDAAGELTSTYVEGKLRTVRYAVMPLLPPKQIIADPTAADHGPIATTLEALLRAKRYVYMLKKDENEHQESNSP